MHNNGNAAKPALLAYSEWRPTRWRVKDSNGRNHGLFTSHRKAATFADGILMGIDDDNAYASIQAVRDTNFFVWSDDSIGLGDGPAIVTLCNEFGSQSRWPVRQVLAMAPMVDANGMRRIVSALRRMAGSGKLHPDDLAAWRHA